MLSMSRDNEALQKNFRYYLKEVEVPDGYLKEDIYWSFVIGDNDDWDNYVYADDSVMQISNASEKRALAIRKVYEDRTGNLDKGTDEDKKDWEELFWDARKDDKFEIIGKEAGTDKTIYYKKVSYSDFKNVDVPLDPAQGYSGPTKSERYYILRDLKPGVYTVREIVDMPAEGAVPNDAKTLSASIPGTDLTTLVSGERKVTPIDEVSDKPDYSRTQQFDLTGGSNANSNGNVEFTFEVETGYETSVDAVFTNIYTAEDAETTSLKINKKWDFTAAGENASVYEGKQAEFELYADGVKFNLTEAEGGNADGNFVLRCNTANHNSAADTYEAVLNTLPRKNKGGSDIVWTIKEVGAVYTVSDVEHNASGDYLKEHFTVTADTASAGGTDQNVWTFSQSTVEGQPDNVQFTNTLNRLTTVKVTKKWKNTQGVEDNDAYTGDVIYFKLYRTTNDISLVTDYKSYVTENNLTPVLSEDIELNAANHWTYTNDLLEKTEATTGNSWNYFVVEGSVAGYDTAYTRTTPAGKQNIEITNTENGRKGSIVLQKNITNTQNSNEVPNPAGKQFKFTLWNSGRYLSNKVSAESAEADIWASKEEDRIFSVPANGSLTISGVPVGVYILTELRDEAQIGGYKLVNIDGSPAPVGDYQKEVSVYRDESGQAGVSVSVEVRNDYKKTTIPSGEFTFGKAWVIPDTEETNTLEWPSEVQAKMKVYKRIKGSSEQGTLVGTYTLIGPERTGPKNRAEDLDQITIQKISGDYNLVQVTDQTNQAFNNRYNHYLFSLKNLPLYDIFGNELEYYVIEDTSDTSGTGTSVDRTFTPFYGYVNGIGADVDESLHEAKNDGEKPGYVINRLNVKKHITIPVQKFIDGRFDLVYKKVEDGGNIPAFTFQLLNSSGKPYKEEDGTTFKEGTVKESDASGSAVFDLTALNLIDLNEMRWYSEEKKLKGKYTFWIEENNFDNNTGDYLGITKIKGKAKVIVNVTYDWLLDDLSVTWSVTNPGEKVPVEDPEKVTITNTYSPGSTLVKVNKTWNDANNQDGYRVPAKFRIKAKYTGDNNTEKTLDSVYFLKDGENGKKEIGTTFNLNTYRLTVGTKSNDSASVRLPKYYEGHEITYTVEEDPVANYISSPADETGTVTNTHTPDTIKVKVTKTWNGAGHTVSEEEKAAVKVRLKATIAGTTITAAEIEDTGSQWHELWSPYIKHFEEKTLTKDAGTGTETWSYTWQAQEAQDTNPAVPALPRFAPGMVGRKVTYTVEEVEDTIPIGYKVVQGNTGGSAVNGGTYEQTLTNTYESVDLPIRKVWLDDDNRDGLRQDVTFTLTAKVGNTVVPNNELEYSNGTKFVEYDGNQQVVRDDTVKSLGTANSSTWDYDGWSGLPKYYHGKEITYTVEEAVPQAFEGKYTSTRPSTDADDRQVPDENGRLVFTNEHVVDITKAVMTKTWDDANNQDGLRLSPRDYVECVRIMAVSGTDENPVNSRLIPVFKETNGNTSTFELYYSYNANDSTQNIPVKGQGWPQATLTIEGSNAASGNNEENYNKYTLTCINLPRNEKNNGGLIQYVMYETAEGATDDTALTSGGTFQSFTTGSSYVLTEGNSSTPAAPANGEDGVPVYSYAATNKHAPETITVQVTKEWPIADGTNPGSDNDHRNLTPSVHVTLKAKEATGSYMDLDTDTSWAGYKTKVRQDSETLQQSFERTLAQSAQSESSWFAQWIDVPKYAPGKVGQLLTYSVTETVGDIPLGYVVMADDQVQKSVTLYTDTGSTLTLGQPSAESQPEKFTNTYEERPVSVTKIWQDDDNRDGKRGTVTIQLHARLGGATGEIIDFKDSKWEKEGVNAWTKYTDGSHGGTVNGNGGIDDSGNWTNTITVDSPGTDHSADSKWVGGWTHLPKYALGQEVYYYVTEVECPAEYTKGTPVRKENGDYEITNTLISAEEATDFKFTKTWDDSNNRDGKRPDPVSFVLANLRVYMEHARINGTEYTNVMLKPEQVDDKKLIYLYYYKWSLETRTWEKVGDSPVQIHGHEIATVTVTGSNGDNTSAELTAADNTQVPYNEYYVKFSNLPKNWKDGQAIVYSMKEIQGKDLQGNDLFSRPQGDGVTAEQMHRYGFVKNGTVQEYAEEYEVEKSTGTNYTFTATNKHEPDLINITVTKSWTRADGSEHGGAGQVLTPPEQTYTAQVQLYEDETAVGEPVTLGPTSWSHTWSNNPNYHVYKDNKVGQKIEYSVREVGLHKGYVEIRNDDVTSTDPSGTLARTIENKYTTGSLRVGKTVVSDVVSDATHDFHFRVELTNIDKLTEGGWTFHPDRIVIKDKNGNEVSNSSTAFSLEDGQGNAYSPAKAVATFTLKNGEYIDIANLPIGTEYTVEEYGPNTVETAFLQNFNTVKTGDTGTIVADTNAATPGSTASFTNTRKTGELTITKTVDRQNAIPDDDQKPFTFNLTLPNSSTLNYNNNHIKYRVDNSGDWTVVKNDTDMPIQIQIHHGQIITVTGLPVETIYTVSEEVDNDFNTQYSINNAAAVTGGTLSNKKISLKSDKTVETDEVTFTNTRKTGSLTLTKSVISPVQSEHENEYKLTVTLTKSGTVVVDPVDEINITDAKGTISNKDISALGTNGTVSFDVYVKEGASAKITGIPVGVTYAVAESSEKYPDFNINITSNGTLISTTESSETVTNTRKTGTLSVTKKVSSAMQGDKEHEFRFRLTLTPPELTPEYVLVESANHGTDSRNQGITFTNDTTKHVSTAEFYVRAGSNGTNTVTINDLPIGWKYTIEEVKEDSDTGIYQSANFTTTVTGDGSNPANLSTGALCGRTSAVAVSQNAEFTNTRKTGSLRIDKGFKTVDGIEKKHWIEGDDDQDFTFKVTLTPPSGTNLDFNVTGAKITVERKAENSDTVTSTDVTGSTFYVTSSKNRPAVIKGIPVGTQYSIEEVASESDIAKQTSSFFLDNSTHSGKIVWDSTTGKVVDQVNEATASAAEEGSPSSKTFTNDRKTGNLVIKKAVVSPIAKEDTDDSYDVKVQLNPVPLHKTYNVYKSWDGTTGTVEFNNSGAGTISVKAGGYVVIQKIPVDVKYTITEPGYEDRFDKKIQPLTATAATAHDDGTNTDTTTYTLGTPGAEQNPNTQVENTITENTYTGALITNTRKLGQLTVSKAVTSNYYSDKTDGWYLFKVEVAGNNGDLKNGMYGTDNTGMFFRGGKAYFWLKNNQSMTATGLPSGYNFTVEELTAIPNQSETGMTNEEYSVLAANTRNPSFAKDFTTSWSKMESGQGGTHYSPAQALDSKIFPGSLNDTNNSIVSDGNSTVAYTNTRKTGSLTINKELSNAIPADVTGKFYFDVTLTQYGSVSPVEHPTQTDAPKMTLGGTEIPISGSETDCYYNPSTGIIHNVPVTWTENGSSRTVINNIPVGTTYTVTEKARTNFIVDGSIDGGTIVCGTPDQHQSVTADNARETGSLAISKVVTSPVKAEHEAEYKLQVVLDPMPLKMDQKYVVTSSNGTVIDKGNNGDSVSTDNSNNKLVTFTEQAGENNKKTGVATLYIKGDTTLTIAGIPVEVKCTVTEIDNNDSFDVKYAKEASLTPAVNAKDTPVEVTMVKTGAVSQVQNIRKTGDLMVGKSVWSAVKGDDDHLFTFKVKMTSPNNSDLKLLTTVEHGNYVHTDTGSPEQITFDKDNKVTFKLKAGETQTITGLPVDWTYTVEELKDDNLTEKMSTVTNQSMTVTGASGTGTTTLSTSTSSTAVSTDDLTADNAVAGVSKAITGNDENDALTNTAVFTNKRNTGTLKITKALNNAIYSDDGDTFYFDVELTRPAEENNKEIELDANAPITVTWAGETQTVQTVDTTPAADSHTLYYEYNTSNNKGIIHNVPVKWLFDSGNGSTTITGIPVDTTCSVKEQSGWTNENKTEAQLPRANVTRNSDTAASETISTSGGTKTTSFTNTRDNSGSLAITKSVTSPIAAEETDDYYKLTVTLNPMPKKLEYYNISASTGAIDTSKSDGDAEAQNVSGYPYKVKFKETTGNKAQAVLYVKGGQTVTIKDIPLDVSYTVSEEQTEYPNFTVTNPAGGLINSSNKNAAATVRNCK